MELPARCRIHARVATLECVRGTTVALLACAFGLVLLLAQCEIGKIAVNRYGHIDYDERDRIHE